MRKSQLRAYIDDSGEKEYGPQTSRYFVYAAVIVREEDELRLNTELARIKCETFGTDVVELKSNWIRQKQEARRRYLDPFSITAEQLDDCIERVYQWAAQDSITLAAAVVDKLQMKERYGDGAWHPSAIAYQFLLQRYQKHLSPLGRVGYLTMDNITGASPAANQWRDLLRNHHKSLKRDGCRITKLRFDNVAPELRFGDSKAFHLLQIADLVAYNVFRQFRDNGEQWDKGGKCPIYGPLQRMLPRFMQSATGLLDGYGIVKWPRNHQGRYRLDQ